MNVYKNTVGYGDHVLFYTTPEVVQMVKVTPAKVVRNRFGEFRHSDVVGKPYGAKVSSTNGRGYVTLLFPTPELWTLCLPHRTQILYFPDISFVTSYLELKPGVKMIESGTGSGSFSHSIARSIAPTGKLYSFEYHQERAECARKEFEEHGFTDLVVVECRDVCKDGFGLEDAVTAVFLDLPAPWEAVPAAKKAFKRNRIGRICSFSPNIEQVSRTCIALHEAGFREIKMFECLLRHYELKTVSFKPIPAAQPVVVSREKLHPRQLVEGSWDEVSEEAVKAYEAAHPPPSNDSESPAAQSQGETVIDSDTVNGPSTLVVAANEDENGMRNRKRKLALSSTIMSRPKREAKTHTAYLMFGILPPQRE
ncbi:hypothetical protein SeMB42_g03900 [Synchytrium endobioticum]|uniref:tRNA (adenine(58)-N(1))-methyltransferase catalytic subunit TRM61 n=1 Tax=Synchytrium endobioticum TaxID=286115 RepID=A0A507D9F0_9FUNG|nr:hypothetical protein SeMB42_g03900 [Synchytrium endobioticum]TPX48193.1 hypothetical protein SeLEV6574_g02171 [Synchytrium endobioticum]